MRWLDGITNSTDMSLSELQEMVKNREAWHATVQWITKSWTRLSNEAHTECSDSKLPALIFVKTILELEIQFLIEVATPSQPRYKWLVEN